MKKTFYRKSYFTRLCRLISSILWKIIILFLPSTAEFFDFIVFLSASQQRLKELWFCDDSKGDFSTTKKLPKNYFILMSLIFLKMKRMKKYTEFL